MAGKYRFACDGHPFYQSNCAREDVIVITYFASKKSVVFLRRYVDSSLLRFSILKLAYYRLRVSANEHQYLRSAFSPANGSELVSPRLPRYYAATVARSVAHRQAGIGNILP